MATKHEGIRRIVGFGRCVGQALGVYVVLDASAITGGDWHLRGAGALTLIEGSRRGAIGLVVPEIVVREVTNSFCERATKLIEQLRNLHGISGTDDALVLAGRASSFDGEFRNHLKNSLAEIPPLDSATHEELVSRALARRRPFDAGGKTGYRDALLWHSILALAPKGEVLLVSKDGGFAALKDKNRLHDHLIDDLRERDFSEDRVRLAGSIESAVRSIMAPADALAEELRNRLAQDAQFRETLIEELLQALHRASLESTQGLYVDLDLEAEPYARWVNDEDLEDVSELRNVLVDRAYPAGEGEYSVQLSVEAVAHFRVEISTQGFYERPPRGDFEFSPDERFFYASGSADVRIEFWSRYSEVNRAFEEHELVTMENR